MRFMSGRTKPRKLLAAFAAAGLLFSMGGRGAEIGVVNVASCCSTNRRRRAPAMQALYGTKFAPRQKEILAAGG